MNTHLDSSQEYRATLRREKFKATAIWNDMVNHLRGNVVVKRRRWKMKSYDDCFQGSEAIEVLQNYVKSHPDLRHTVSRAQLRNLCQIFVQKRILESVEDNQRTDFEDGSKLYRFVDVAYSNTGPQVRQDFRRLVVAFSTSSFLTICVERRLDFYKIVIIRNYNYRVNACFFIIVASFRRRLILIVNPQLSFHDMFKNSLYKAACSYCLICFKNLLRGFFV